MVLRLLRLSSNRRHLPPPKLVLERSPRRPDHLASPPRIRIKMTTDPHHTLHQATSVIHLVRCRRRRRTVTPRRRKRKVAATDRGKTRTTHPAHLGKGRIACNLSLKIECIWARMLDITGQEGMETKAPSHLQAMAMGMDTEAHSRRMGDRVRIRADMIRTRGIGTRWVDRIRPTALLGMCDVTLTEAFTDYFCSSFCLSALCCCCLLE